MRTALLALLAGLTAACSMPIQGTRKIGAGSHDVYVVHDDEKDTDCYLYFGNISCVRGREASK